MKMKLHKERCRSGSTAWLRFGYGFFCALLFTAVGSLAAEDSGGIAEATLAARSGPRTTTMFTELSPQQTGLVTENNYADPKMWAEHYQELIYGAIGTGVAIGDYDNDGRPDIFVVSKTERSRLFRNLGNWKFEDVTERAFSSSAPSSWTDTVRNWIGASTKSTDSIEAWKQGAVFADINNDGYLDLYVCRFGAPNLLYVNRGDGTFLEEAARRGLAVVDGSAVAAFCDYDRDGWLDVYVQTNMLNAATHPNGRRDYLFRNNGDGMFTDVTDRAGIVGESAGHSVAWWDYDGDSWPDIYVANDFAEPDRLYRNNRDGTFSDMIHAVVPHMPYYAMGSDLGDINNDGLLDLFVGDMAPGTHEKDQRGMAGSRMRAQVEPANPKDAPQYMRNALYVNTGTGRMLEAAQLAGVEATDWTWSVRFEDLDNDGRIDLHVTNGMAREYHNADLLARLMAAENTAESRRMMKSSPRLDETNFAFRNLGDLRFEKVGGAWGLDETGVSFGAAFGDLDGDGDLDLVHGNYEKGATLLRNDSQDGHRLIVALRGTRSNRFGVGATVRIETVSGVQVRQLVASRGYLSSSEPVLHFGLGEDTAITRLTVEWPSGMIQTFPDLPADRRLTISEPGDSADAVAEAIKSTTASIDDPATLFRVSDALGGPSADEQDAAVRVEADFDRDGDLDAFIGGEAINGKYPLHSPSKLLLRRNDEWNDVTADVGAALSNVGLVADALWSDLDADGWPDLLLAVEWGHVKFFHNREGRGFEDWSERSGLSAAGTGWWRSLAVADFNGDGRLDIAAGNLGLNTRYRASIERPALLLYGNWIGASPMGIEAYYEGDRLLPWLTRSELAAKLPSLARKFPRNDNYARATLAEIFGEDRLAGARRFAATEFSSGVFLSQPDGVYTFSPLPRIAQIAPIQAMVTGDFDGDGRVDLYAGQNSHAPAASIGRFDGGLSQLLSGDGRGAFNPVPHRASGLVVPGETSGISILDRNNDGWPDVVVSRAKASSLEFLNNGVSGRKSVRIVLEGRPANPRAIGARVVGELADGTTQIFETSVASGHCFLGFPETNPLRQIRVRWPSGKKSVEEISTLRASITLVEPES